MGVKDLWQVLEPVGKREPLGLHGLRGKRLAIDLSLWIYESMALQDKVENWSNKRMMIHKVLNMLKYGMKPVFVLEGKTPKLKEATVMARQSQSGRPTGSSCSPDTATKGAYACIESQWVDLLSKLDLPYIRAPGEAEAMCAQLNQQQLVDACVTNDGDALLFGAQRVIKNFTCNTSKEDEIEVYDMNDVDAVLGMQREHLVALALLVGCDYDNQGVAGIGKENAIKLIKQYKDEDIFKRFKQWREEDDYYNKLESYKKLPKPSHCASCGHLGTKVKHKKQGCATCGTDNSCTTGCEGCMCEYHRNKNKYEENSVELHIRSKALAREDFPSQEIIDAFLKPEESNVTFQWVDPNFSKFQSYLRSEMSWPESKILENILPIFTMWEMMTAIKEERPCVSRPQGINRERTVHFLPVYEVQWKFVNGVDVEEEHLMTVEEKTIFKECFPSTVKMFHIEQERKHHKAKYKNKRKAEMPASNKRIDQMWKVRKRLDFSKETVSTPKAPSGGDEDDIALMVMDDSDDEKLAGRLVKKAEMRKKLNFTPDRRFVRRAMEADETDKSREFYQKEMASRIETGVKGAGHLTPVNFTESDNELDVSDSSLNESTSGLAQRLTPIKSSAAKLTSARTSTPGKTPAAKTPVKKLNMKNISTAPRGSPRIYLKSSGAKSTPERTPKTGSGVKAATPRTSQRNSELRTKFASISCSSPNSFEKDTSSNDSLPDLETSEKTKIDRLSSTRGCNQSSTLRRGRSSQSNPGKQGKTLLDFFLAKKGKK